MRKSLIVISGCIVSCCFAGLLRAADAPASAEFSAVAKFRMQEIDKSLKVGYAVKLIDLNGDGKPDIVVVDSARVIWFENPGAASALRMQPGAPLPWKLHTIIDDKAAGVIADNVCLDVADLDGDGKLDIVLGADWVPGDTHAHGSLQWLRQPAKDIDQPWEVHKIFESEPTLHRIHFGDIDGNGKPVLVVGPLKGRDSTTKANNMDHGVRLLAYRIPKDPVKDEWKPEVLTEDLHVLHNFLPIQWNGEKEEEILTASYEGVNVLHKGSDGKWKLHPLGTGNQEKPEGSRGSSEVKVGRLKMPGESRFIATIEPFHGFQAVVYTPATAVEGKGAVWTRTVLDDKLTEGHGVWCADLDGDGNDEVVIGWRGGKGGIRIFKAQRGGPEDAPTWQKHELDPGGVAVEDLACLDLNGDGKTDIVAVGRATHNVRIYWNEGKE